MDLSAALAAANPNSATNQNAQSKFGNDFSQFLKLLTTQLQNQDPLSPMETEQFTSQLVQFSGVEQQLRSNDYLQKLLALNTTNLTSVALGYIGLNVYTPGNSFRFDGVYPSDVSYTMPEEAKNATLTILDKFNNIVYSGPAETSAGQHKFSWDGNDIAGVAQEPGDYTIRIGAQDAEGKAITVGVYTSGIVEGVETKDDGNVNVIINGKPVPVDSVRQAAIQKYVLQQPTGDGGTDGTSGDETGTDVAG